MLSEFICVSKFVAQDLHTQLGAPSHNLRVIPHGVDDRFFQPAPSEVVEEVRQRYQLDKPFILYVGDRLPHKNIVGLLKAFALFKRMTPQPYQLVIAGQQFPHYKEPEKIIKQYGLTDAVTFLDYIGQIDLPLLYQAAEVFVLLSYYEGFGLPILEAMASGTPVVAANCTALPEVVGEAGLLVEPDNPDQAADALCQVINGGAKREQMVALGNEHARQFTWERCAQKTMEIYREARDAVNHPFPAQPVPVLHPITRLIVGGARRIPCTPQRCSTSSVFASRCSLVRRLAVKAA